MAGRTETKTVGRQVARGMLACVLASTFLVTDLVPVAGLSSAAAQERPRTIIDMLFGAPPRRRYIEEAPPRRVLRKKPRQQRKKPARAARRPSASRKAAPAAAAAAAVAPSSVAKSETARTVLVVGDFLASSLASGLEDTVCENAEVKVVASSDGSSGFVRDDHYDWLAKIGPLIDETKPAVVVAMLGSNDRQPISAGGQSFPARSEGWIAEYERRVDAFAKTIHDKNLPLVWVGMPSFKFDRMSEDMAYLNEIYRKAATTTGGGEFVDIWDGFVDANGAFSYSGPDIAGQPARLRNSDGITMTSAGSEKLAFFAEKPILRLLGTTADGSAPIALAPGDISAVPLPPIANAANATSTPVVALNDPSLDGGATLLGGGPGTEVSPEPSPRDKLVVSGAPSAGSAERADNFNWSAKTTAVAPMRPAETVVFRGSVDLNKVRTPEPRAPLKPMPSLQDAIIDDWAAQSGKAKNTAPGAADAKAPASGPATTAELPPARVSPPPASPAAAAPEAVVSPPAVVPATPPAPTAELPPAEVSKPVAPEAAAPEAVAPAPMEPVPAEIGRAASPATAAAVDSDTAPAADSAAAPVSASPFAADQTER